jgi:hypothetical protein
MVCDDPKKLQRLQDAASNGLAEAERGKIKWFLKDEVAGFLRELGGGAAAGTIAGRTVTVKHSSANLEGEAKAHEEINKAVAEALRKRKKGGSKKS